MNLITGFFYKLPRNIIRVFSRKNLKWHLIAIILTFLIVVAGFDWSYFLYIQSDNFHSWLFPAVIIGGLIPIVLPLILLCLGIIFKNVKIRGGKDLINTSWAIGQSAMIGYLVSSFYKAFTGRIQPNTHDLITDISSKFQFGFWEHGIFWGWPSSHTTIAFATMVTLMVLYSKNKTLKFFALVYALYIGLGVTVGIHWFSEFVAGAIIGSIIGIVVGKCFKEKI